jgi:hypothetical protein
LTLRRFNRFDKLTDRSVLKQPLTTNYILKKATYTGYEIDPTISIPERDSVAAIVEGTENTAMTVVSTGSTTGSKVNAVAHRNWLTRPTG